MIFFLLRILKFVRFSFGVFGVEFVKGLLMVIGRFFCLVLLICIVMLFFWMIIFEIMISLV